MSNNFETVWERIPFNGGVNYHCGTLTITGEYSSNPLQFESDCLQWILTNAIGSIKYGFDTLAEAMDAAEFIEV